MGATCLYLALASNIQSFFSLLPGNTKKDTVFLTKTESAPYNVRGIQSSLRHCLKLKLVNRVSRITTPKKIIDNSSLQHTIAKLYEGSKNNASFLVAVTKKPRTQQCIFLETTIQQAR